MSIDIERHLVDAMREQVNDLAVRDDLVARAARRNRRRTVMRRSAYLAGVAGVAGTLAVALGIGAGRPPHAGPDDAPGMRLAAAVAATQQVSYRFTVQREFVPGPDAALTAGARSMLQSRDGTSTGAYDPAAGTGYLQQDRPGQGEQRMIGGKLFVCFRPLRPTGESDCQWRVLDGRQGFNQFDVGPEGVVKAGVVDPLKVLAALREHGTVTQTRPDEYAFTITVGGWNDIPYNGTVTVGADGRVSRLTYVSRWRFTDTELVGDRITLELSQFGTPVTVDEPAPVVR